jgi:hypothetical protein
LNPTFVFALFPGSYYYQQAICQIGQNNVKKPLQKAILHTRAYDMISLPPMRSQAGWLRWVRRETFSGVCFDQIYEEAVPEDHFLRRFDALIRWELLVKRLRGFYSQCGRDAHLGCLPPVQRRIGPGTIKAVFVDLLQ